MRVQVEVVCMPHSHEEIERALRAAGRQLASRADSVSVELREGERLTAVLEFEMRQAAQYKVVGDIAATVKDSAWAFYEDITIRFPKD
jgi:hypothetical protein